MRKNSLLLAVLFACVAGLTGMKPGDKKKEQEAPKPTLLFAMYPESNYVAKGDFFICEASDVSVGQLRDQWRRSIEAAMYSRLSQTFKATSLGLGGTPGGDLGMVFTCLQPQLRQAQIRSHYSSKPQRFFSNTFKSKKAKYGSDCVNKYELPPNRRTLSFMDLALADSVSLKELNEKHKTQFVLALTHFEMNTRYENCLNMRGSIHHRDLYLHYVFLDSSGKRLDGGIVAVTYYEKTNDAAKILEETLGPLTGLIIENVQKHI